MWISKGNRQQLLWVLVGLVFCLGGGSAPPEGDRFSYYLISAYPSDEAFEHTAPVRLFQLGNHTLVNRGEIFGKRSGCRYVRPTYDLGLVMVADAGAWYLPDRAKEASYKYRALTLAEPWKLLSQFEGKELRGSKREYVLGLPDLGPVLAVSRLEGQKHAFDGWLIKAGTQVEGLPLSCLRYWDCHGVPALGVSGFDSTDLAVSERGEMLIREGKGPNEWPQAGWRAPEKVDWRRLERIFPFVVNQRVVAIAAVEDRVHKSDGIGESSFYFLDVARRAWHRRVLKGGSTSVRGFRDWVAGYVAEKETGTRAESAGEKEWSALDQARLAAGLPTIAQRFEWWRQKAPGVLFVYHVPTERYFEFATHQGDSEVLYIEEEEVYFRSLDKLYRARLTAGTFAEVQLLQRDPVILDMHWMFKGNPWPKHLENKSWTEQAAP